ncbi:MAG: DNA topoisomerase VI subunit B [Methanomicrobiales archaeon]|nr:DNA topoisomerase VI subunit B [Methanomicrobiales archaeon]
MTLAEELARKQRSISVAEFFEKNKHLLGFDSPTRGIITTIKEAVDNALDACEEASVLPDILIRVRKVSDEQFRITVEDNGPGIVPEQIPYVFGKLLYGSRFHQIRQSRGQQGIGISAAVLYAQLTSGMPAVVVSRTGEREKAHRFELKILIEKNEPDIINHEEIDWYNTHGTSVEIEFRSTLAAKKKLIDYLTYTSIVNPHANIRVEIDNEEIVFKRVVHEPIACPRPIQPHPHGIELGMLTRMAAASPDRLEDFLTGGFSRVGKKSAGEICAAAEVSPKAVVKNFKPEELKKLLAGMQAVRIPPPPTTVCLSPIGEDLIRKGLDEKFSLDFVRARTRPSGVYSGHPFVVEAAVGYGAKLPTDQKALILRFANRVPLMYQQGACAITNAIAGVNWKQYGVGQETLPVGPMLVLVHIASTNVPFTSESKDAVAAIPDIEKEIDLVLKELGRELKQYLNQRDRKKDQDDRNRAICSIIPEIAHKVSEIVEKPVVDTSAIEGKIMHRLIARKWTANGVVQITLRNHTAKTLTLSLYNVSHDKGEKAQPAPAFTDQIDDVFTKIWKVDLPPGEGWGTSYPGRGGGTLEVQGVEESLKVVVDSDV